MAVRCSVVAVRSPVPHGIGRPERGSSASPSTTARAATASAGSPLSLGLVRDRRVQPAERVDEPVQLDAGVAFVQAALEGGARAPTPSGWLVAHGVEDGQRAPGPGRDDRSTAYGSEPRRTGQVGAAQHGGRGRVRHRRRVRRSRRRRGGPVAVEPSGSGDSTGRPAGRPAGPRPSRSRRATRRRGRRAQRGQPAGGQRGHPGVEPVRAGVERLGEQAVQLARWAARSERGRARP